MTISDQQGNLHAANGTFTEKQNTEAPTGLLTATSSPDDRIRAAYAARDAADHELKLASLAGLEEGLREFYPTAKSVSVFRYWDSDENRYDIQTIEGPDGNLFDIDEGRAGHEFNTLNRFVGNLGRDAGAYLTEFEPEGPANGEWARFDIGTGVPSFTVG